MKYSYEVLEEAVANTKRKGIHLNPEHKGALHEQLGIKPGMPIPEKKLEKGMKVAAKTQDPLLKKRIIFAQNARLWNKRRKQG